MAIIPNPIFPDSPALEHVRAQGDVADEMPVCVYCSLYPCVCPDIGGEASLDVLQAVDPEVPEENRCEYCGSIYQNPARECGCCEVEPEERW